MPVVLHDMARHYAIWFRSIMYQGAMIWNSLPVELKEVDELAKLKDCSEN